jgi:hypothetical protein
MPDHVFHPQNPRRTQLRIDQRYVDGRVTLELTGKPLNIGQLDGKIDFPAETAGKLVDNGHGLMPLNLFQVLFHQFGNMGQNLKINRNDILNSRPLHLDHHLGAAVETGPVHLTDGRGRQGLGVEIMEDFLGITSQFFLEDGTNLLQGKRRNIVLQLGQFIEEIGGNQVGPGGKQLPQLNERRPQFLEHQPQPLRSGQPGNLLARFAVDHLQPGFQILVDMQAIDQIVEAVLEQNPQNTMVAVEMAVLPAKCAEFPNAEHRKITRRCPC